jgi:hypothetical protein
MGKTADNNVIKSHVKEEEEKAESVEKRLPIPLPSEKEVFEIFSGKFIGIVDGKIIAVDSSLRELQLKVKRIIPEGKDCTVEYFEDGVSIFGSYFL